MALGRHLSRLVIVKTLFSLLFSPEANKDKALQISLEGTKPVDKDLEFISNVLDEIMKNMDHLKKKIQEYATERPLDSVSLIDQAVLYLGAYELIYGNHDEVPGLVAINEAVDISKDFSGDTNAGFINGVLNSIYQEGKEEDSKLESKPVRTEFAPGGN